MSEFVTFEISKKLKEKGYPQLKKGTLAMYNEEGEWFSLAQYLDDYEYCFDDFDEHDCVAPTISQVLKWLREEKDIFIEITVDVNDKFNYYFGIYKKGNDTWEYIGQNDTYDYFEMYEEAAMAGIEWVLDNILL